MKNTKNTYGKILTPPTKENVGKWLNERFGNDFEPKYFNSIIEEYFSGISKHTEYSKKLTVKYISENIIKFDRIYRKQETLYWIKRGWNNIDAETKRIVRNKQWYIDTYGLMDGLEKFNNKNTKISNNCGHTLEKYIVRYGEELGSVKYDEYKKTCARNLEFFVKKYGEKDGKNRYKDFKKHIGKASKESLLVFNPLIDWLKNHIDINEIYYGDKNSREFFIIKNSKTYLFDFTIKSLKLIIEFNGIKFHVNENWSDETKKLWSHPFKKMKYLEAIKNDQFKKNLAEENGFKILTIWSDIPVEENVEICKQFIKNEIK